MKKTRISGIGLVNQAGISSGMVWEALCAGMPAGEVSAMTAFKPDAPASKLRRVNRYCKMALYASKEAYRDGEISEEISPLERGTIFTTGYGSMAAHVKFCRETAKGDPDFCSPTVFTGIVPNSCVGTVCMFLDCKGVSTVLSGGNALEYSKLLLEGGRAQVILSGAVEEYTPELFEGVQQGAAADGAVLAEGCVVFALEQLEEKKGYCGVQRTDTIGLAGFPLLEQIEAQTAKQQMIDLFGDYAGEQPEVIFGSGNGTWWDEVEAQAFAEGFSQGECLVSNRIKQVAGETMGCGFSMNVAAAALCLKHGYVPGALLDGSRDVAVTSILVTGFDTAGNYMCALLCS